MFSHLNHARRFRHSTFIALAGAVLATVGGCATDSDTRNGSVQVNSRTTNSSDDTQFDVSRSFPTGDKSTGVLLVEISGPRSVRLQHQADYQMKVTNLTDTTVKNVIVASTTPEGFQPTAVGGSTTQPANGQLQYAVGDLEPKESKTFQVSGMGTKVGSVDTCYSVTYNPPTLCTAVQVTNPAIALEVNAPADTDICKSVTYEYKVSNTGTGVAHHVTLEENLPDGLQTTDGKNVVSADLGDIPQGEFRTAKADIKATKTGKFPGQAIAKSDGDASQPVSTATAVHAPVLAVNLTGSENDYVGKTVPLKIVVTNKGDATATNAKLQLRRPADGIGSIAASNIDDNGTIALGDIPANSTKEVDATLSSDRGGTVIVNADASADCASPVSTSAQTKFNTIPALLLETVDESDPIRVGENVIYDVKVTNQGTGPDTNVSVKAMVPDGEQYISTEGATQPAVSGSTLTFPAIPTLQPKESVTWKVTVKSTKAGDVQFRTSATSDGVKTGAEKVEPTKLY